jgi:hypothetical protein
MQVGDLVKEKEYPEVGLILKIKDETCRTPYGIMCPSGKVEWFTKAYLEERCEVISANR